MTSRDSQTVTLSRQAILLVTAVGVGLLTLCYVLGVQVGKQSAALRHPQARGAGEDLQELPASVEEQLKNFDRPTTPLPAPAQPPSGAAVPSETAPAPGRGEGETAPEPPRPAPAEKKADKKPEPAKADPRKPEPPKSDARKADPRKPDPVPRWSLQLVSTPDAAEAQKMAAKAKGAGFQTVTVTEHGLHKVRLSAAGSREAMDAQATKLKNRGYKPFAVKVP